MGNKYTMWGAYHWKAYGTEQPYTKYVDSVVKWVKGDRILDVGAGDGLITKKLGAEGVEIVPIAVEMAQKRKVKVTKGDAYDLPFNDNSFDTVFMGDTIEHLEEPEKAVAEVKRVCTNKFYITTPPAGDELYSHHVVEYTPETLDELVAPFGFTREEIFIKYDRIHALYTLEKSGMRTHTKK